MKKILFCIGLAAICIASCRKDTKVDLVQPIVTRVEVGDSSATTIELTAGSSFQLTIEASDNESLNEVLVEIHAAEDAHEHQGNGHAGGEFHLNSGEWQNQQVLQANNASATLTAQISVPGTIAGQWHLVVTAKDDVGNTSLEYTLLLNVTNDELPLIEGVTTPLADATGTVSMQAGSSLLLAGTVSDADGLAGVQTYLLTYSGLSGDTTVIPMSGNPTLLTFPEMSFDNAQIGEYRLVIEAFDTQGNRRWWDNRVVVSE
jgi:hypothetical protein